MFSGVQVTLENLVICDTNDINIRPAALFAFCPAGACVARNLSVAG